MVSKTVSGTSSATGGYAVPEVISRMIHEKLQDLSPVRQVCDVTPITTSDYKELVDVNGESYEWVAEGGTRSQQTEPQLAEVAPTLGTINAYYWANEEAIDDMFINVQSWLTMAAARAFARGEGAAFVSGNGTNKPTGFLNATPSSAGDEDSPARAFGTLQYLPTGAAYAASAPFGDLANTSPTFYPDHVFINAVAELKTGYQAGAVWLMNRATMGHVRKIRDADGRSMWQQSMAAGMPSTIMGFPVVEFPDMPDVGTNAFPVAFGNFREGYLFVERAGVRITMDEVTKPGAIKWNIRRRVGGKTRNDDAIKVIKLAAS
jgi:HK97 family phage major capsid protein